MKKLKLGFLVSGRGSNMHAIIDACLDGTLNAEPVLVISNNMDSGALEIARSMNIPAYHYSARTHPDPVQLDQAMTEILMTHKIDVVILAGFMKKIGPVMLNAFRGRILNIHPSLLPKYGGQGMYGMKVHEAVIDSGDKVTGVTVHLVDDNYDQGTILAQRVVEISENDTSETLAERVLGIEHTLFVEVLKDIIKGKIKLSGIATST